jgi:hypothetical protein
MEEPLREAPPNNEWREALAQTIDQQRRRVGERIASQRERLHELESRIAAHLDEVAQSLTRQHSQVEKVAAESQAQQADAARRAAELDQTKAELAEERQRLAAQQKEISRREAELDQLQTGLAGQNAVIRQQADELKRKEAELTAARQAHEAEVQKLHTQMAECQRLQSDLKLQAQTHAESEQRSVTQRRHIAHQLRARKKELAAEIEVHRAEMQASASGQDLQLQVKLAELQGRYDRLREDFDRRQEERDDATHKLAELKAQAEARQRDAQHHQESKEQAQRKQGELEAELKRLRNIEQELAEARRKAQTAEAAQAELDRVRQRAEEQIQQLRASQDKSSDEQVKALQTQLDELRKRETQFEKQHKELETEISALKAAGSSDSSAASAELAKLREENKQLETWLAEAEEKAKQGGGSAEGGGPELEDLRRRFEMAIQDVRELKTKNAELTEQVARNRQAGSTGGGGGGGSDWESMKQKMLAQLESDFDDADESQKAEKLTVQQAIQTTDQALADKERELEELRKLLDSQAQRVGEVAVGASAIAQVLDTDELIRQERATLKQLQESLREQLAKAEIDISLERAKQARERAELEEKMRTMEAERSNGSTPGDANGDKGKKAGGRKWLTRLGLGDTKGE